MLVVHWDTKILNFYTKISYNGESPSKFVTNSTKKYKAV